MQDLHHRLVRHIALRRKIRGGSYNPVKLLSRLIVCARSDETKADLAVLKIAEARILQMWEVVYDSIMLYLSLYPLRPEPWLQLIVYYRDDSVDLTRATMISGIAVGVAKLDGNFIRQALGERIRTLLIASDIAAANDCLSKLIDFRPAKDSIDINFESDFLHYPSASELDQKLVAEYRAMIS